MFKNTSIIISTPENVYLDKKYFDFRCLEAEILTRVICGLCRLFLKWPPLGSVKCFFGHLKIFSFVASGLQNIHLDIDIYNICGLEADIKIIDSYHIFGQPFLKWLPLKSLKCSVLD